MKVKQHTTVGDSYSQALLNLAQQEESVDTLYDELHLILAELRGPLKIRAFLEAPHINKKLKHTFINETIAPSCSKTVTNLLHLVIDMNRSRELIAIIETFHDQVEQSRGILPGFVESAVELNSLERDQIKNALERLTDKKLHIRYTVNKELLGGILFKTENMLIDDTVRGYLRLLSDHLGSLEMAF